MTILRLVVDLGVLGALAYTAVLNGPPEGEGLRVRLSALGLTLLTVALSGAGLWLTLGHARFDALLLGVLFAVAGVFHFGPPTGLDRGIVFCVAVLLVFPLLVRRGARLAKKRSDEAIAAAITRWGRPGAWAPPPDP